MRKVVVSYFMSLDGVVEDPHTFPTDWDDDAMDAFTAEALVTQDAVILGRTTYDEWSTFWPTSIIEPYATFINAVAKFVVTSTPLDVAWTNTTAFDGDLVEFVRALQAQPGGDIAVHGSISVAHALLAAGLVDELKLAVIPAIAGTGRRLLDGTSAARLETVRSATSPSGKLLVEYRIEREAIAE